MLSGKISPCHKVLNRNGNGEKLIQKKGDSITSDTNSFILKEFSNKEKALRCVIQKRSWRKSAEHGESTLRNLKLKMLSTMQ